MSVIRYTGAATQLSTTDLAQLFDRTATSEENLDVRNVTRQIIEQVRQEGDQALLRFARDFDGVDFRSVEQIKIPRTEWQKALSSIDTSLRKSLERAARNIEKVHKAFLPAIVETSPEPGIQIGRRPDPLARVGVYAPGGKATYPSSVLMGAIPARVAQVGEITLCSPPDPSTGMPSQVLLAAAELANVDSVFAVGGAGAIAAMAYGTDLISRVDKIVGPGNAYVAEAKLQVSGSVGIDSPAGPSELLVVADNAADASVIAREVMAQAEHDPDAVVIVLAIGQDTAESTLLEIDRILEQQERKEIIKASLSSRGAVLAVTSAEEAAEFSNRFAPEHLLLAINNPRQSLPLFINAGTVFLGSTSSVAFGDYMTGANHVLPTGGLARSYSGLSTQDFIRWTTYQEVTYSAASSLSNDVYVLASSEGLPAHAAAAEQWGQQDD